MPPKDLVYRQTREEILKVQLLMLDFFTKLEKWVGSADVHQYLARVGVSTSKRLVQRYLGSFVSMGLIEVHADDAARKLKHPSIRYKKSGTIAVLWECTANEETDHEEA